MCSSGKRNLAREKGLLGQPHHDGRILANRIQHDRILEFGRNFANDLNALSFEQV